MKKFKCDICHQTMEKEGVLEGVEKLLQDFINENINDICLECGSKIIEAVYESVNSIRIGDDKLLDSENEFNLDSYLKNNKVIEPKIINKLKNGDWDIPITKKDTEYKSKIIRRKYTKEETLKFKERILELINSGVFTRSNILDFLDKEFPNRLRTSNAIRLKEMIDKTNKTMI